MAPRWRSGNRGDRMDFVMDSNNRAAATAKTYIRPPGIQSGVASTSCKHGYSDELRRSLIPSNTSHAPPERLGPYCTGYRRRRLPDSTALESRGVRPTCAENALDFPIWLAFNGRKQASGAVIARQRDEITQLAR
jgi:hypothetical protein